MSNSTKKFAIQDNFSSDWFNTTSFTDGYGFGVEQARDEYEEENLPQKIMYGCYDPDTGEYENVECELNGDRDAYSAPDGWGFDEYVAHVVEI